jgi:hypothetical protein
MVRAHEKFGDTRSSQFMACTIHSVTRNLDGTFRALDGEYQIYIREEMLRVHTLTTIPLWAG